MCQEIVPNQKTLFVFGGFAFAFYLGSKLGPNEAKEVLNHVIDSCKDFAITLAQDK